jgi:tetrahydromethanopterin S-methyltransferase subunit G
MRTLNNAGFYFGKKIGQSIDILAYIIVGTIVILAMFNV